MRILNTTGNVSKSIQLWLAFLHLHDHWHFLAPSRPWMGIWEAENSLNWVTESHPTPRIGASYVATVDSNRDQLECSRIYPIAQNIRGTSATESLSFKATSHWHSKPRRPRSASFTSLSIKLISEFKSPCRIDRAVKHWLPTASLSAEGMYQLLDRATENLVERNYTDW